MAEFAPSWTVNEYVIPASHPRGYLRGVRDPQTSRLRLHVKQYVPNSASSLGDSQHAITLIVQHGQPPGDNKEAYEPFMWDLICQTNLPPVRAIWALDIASAGKSFLLNRDEIGDEPHWFDASRDILQMVNHFQTEMKPPLVGFGQSWGGAVLAMAASWHPRLFQGLILSEPILETGYYHFNEVHANADEFKKLQGGVAAAGIAKRKRYFSSRKALVESVQRLPMWKAYDPRVLNQILKFDYQDLEDGRVELVTPPYQAFQFFQRPSPALPGYPEAEEYNDRREDANFPPGWYQEMGWHAKQALTGLHCRMLFLWESEGTFVSNEGYRKRVMEAALARKSRENKVQQEFVEGGHSLTLFVPLRTAQATARWLQGVWKEWTADEENRQKHARIDAENIPVGIQQLLRASLTKL
jgi:pimeloyl-ACP methyl ester carboxylesterase